MYDEYQAWLYLEKRWKQAKYFNGFEIEATIFKHRACGLCESITHLWVIGKIYPDTKYAMLGKISMKNPGGGYMWKKTKYGARQRAAFSRKQAFDIKQKK